jgi:hypothetical protein
MKSSKNHKAFNYPKKFLKFFFSRFHFISDSILLKSRGSAKVEPRQEIVATYKRKKAGTRRRKKGNNKAV